MHEMRDYRRAVQQESAQEGVRSHDGGEVIEADVVRPPWGAWRDEHRALRNESCPASTVAQVELLYRSMDRQSFSRGRRVVRAEGVVESLQAAQGAAFRDASQQS